MASGETNSTDVTPTVLWAVIAVTALIPWTPQRANALRSAWIPAPPPESETAIDRTQRGRRTGRVMRGVPLSGRRQESAGRRARPTGRQARLTGDRLEPLAGLHEVEGSAQGGVELRRARLDDRRV